MRLPKVAKELNKLRARGKKQKLSSSDEQKLMSLHGEWGVKQLQYIPLPTCCQAAKDFPIVQFEADPQMPENAGWAAKTFNDRVDWKQARETGFPKVKYCPYCGTQLPEMVKRKDLKNVCRSSDGGYYCDECGERLNGCVCIPTSGAYLPVKHE